MVLYASGSQATIEDTGSTNRPGLRVTFDHGGHATVEQRNGQIDQVKLPSGLCNQFMRDLKEVEPMKKYTTVLEDRVGPFAMRADLAVDVAADEAKRTLKVSGSGEDHRPT